MLVIKNINRKWGDLKTVPELEDLNYKYIPDEILLN